MPIVMWTLMRHLITPNCRRSRRSDQAAAERSFVTGSSGVNTGSSAAHRDARDTLTGNPPRALIVPADAAGRYLGLAVRV
jgi:hypothetical protein